MATSPNIQLLGASNYENWRKDVTMLLKERDVWEIVTGEEEKPVKGDKVDELEFKKELRLFRKRSNAALSTIYLNIELSHRKLVDNIDDPQVMWKEIEKCFRPDNRAYHMQMITKLNECRIEPDETIKLFSARLARIGDEVRSIDKGLSEDYISYQLLRYLPSQFDSIVQSILRWEQNKFNYKNITLELIAESIRLEGRSHDRNVSINFASTSSPRIIKCQICQGHGHYKEVCPSFNNSVRSRKTSQRRNETNRKNFSPSPNRSSTPRNNRGRRRAHRGRIPRQRFTSPTPDNHSFYVTANISESAEDSSAWIFDTAASHHFTGHREYFSSFTPLYNEKLTVAVNGVTFPIEGTGTIPVMWGKRKMTLLNVKYSPNLKKNLISGSQALKNGLKFYGKRNKVEVSDNKLIFTAYLKNGLLYTYPKVLNVSNQKKVSFAAPVQADESIDLWHKRLGHVSTSIISNTSKFNGVKGIPKFSSNLKVNCEPCRINKFKRVSFKSCDDIRSKGPLDLLYSDVWGPAQITGYDGEKYFVSITDDYSRKISLYPIESKSEVPTIVKRHITRAETQLNRRVKAFRSDNGTEYVNNELSGFFKSKGIKHERTNVYTPEQNGVSERYNRTVVDAARTLIDESGFSRSFWPDAMLYFTYTWNRVCRTKLNKTPLELYSGRKPSIRHLKPFGCVAYVGVPHKLRGKLDPKANKGYLLGYSFNTKGYRVWIPSSSKIVDTISVKFNENKMYKDDFGSRDGAVLVPEENTKVSQVPYYNPTCFDDEEEEDIPHKSSRVSTEQEHIEEPVAEEGRSTQPEDTDTSRFPKVSWYRTATLRSDKSRYDIYYNVEGKNKRLRSLNDVKKYCETERIRYEPEIFDFSTKNTYTGPVLDEEDPDETIELNATS